jgi:hypothetical protein
MIAAGREYFPSKLSTNELFDDLHRMLEIAGGRYFTQDFYMRNAGRYSVKTLKSRLGYRTWQQMLREELGATKITKVIVRKERAKPPSESEMLDEIGRVWRDLGRRPKYSEFGHFARIAMRTYERRFGNWQKAVVAYCKEHGVSVQGTASTRTSSDQLRAELEAIAKRHDSAIVQYKDYKRLGGTYSIGTFQTHFGSWRKAVASIGLRSGHSRCRPDLRLYADEDYFAEIQRVWEMLGRQPKAREMKEHARMSPKAFQARFGTWMKAIYAFCADRSGVEDHSPPDPYEKPNVQRIPSIKGLAKPKPAERSAVAREIVIVMTTPRLPSDRLRFRVYKRDDFKCVICGRSPATNPGLQLEADHIIPYSQGGETVLNNLQTLCKQCNRGKSDDMPGK